ncbi:MAG: polyprenyl synthetase family protein [Nanobdellota archaeon]
MDVKKVMQDLKEKIDCELENYFAQVSFPEQGLEILDDIKEFTLRNGKRIRPILLIYGFKAFGGLSEKEIIKASIAVEIMQSFLLIHDDIIDCDETRRGKPTLHKIYEKRNQNITDCPEKLGKDIAIVSGDIASAMGQMIIQRCDFKSDIKLKAIEIFNQALIKTCIGQIKDVYSSYKDIKEKEIESIQRLKTATYTLESPLVLGAVLAGANQDMIEKLKRFAIPIGEAFQIQDDIIGLFGTKEKIGKPVGSDLREGKRTLLIAKAIEWAAESEKMILKKALGDKDITQSKVLQVKNIIEKTGSLKYSKRKAKELLNKGEKELNNLDITDDSREFFKGIIKYMGNREF